MDSLVTGLQSIVLPFLETAVRLLADCLDKDFPGNPNFLYEKLSSTVAPLHLCTNKVKAAKSTCTKDERPTFNTQLFKGYFSASGSRSKSTDATDFIKKRE
jgi:hypothetical protein